LFILKTYDQQFTLTTKKSLHIIFKTVASMQTDGGVASCGQDSCGIGNALFSKQCREVNYAGMLA